MSFKISLKDTSFHISINSLGLYLSPECFLNFLSNFYIPLCVGRIFKFMEFTFLENALIQGSFTHASPHSELYPRCCHHALGRRKLLIPLDIILSKICFPQQQKGVEETMICFIKIQSENMKMTWNIRLFIFGMICNFFKCDGFTVL